MSNVTTTVTSKGQVTIPKDVRDHLHLHPGDRVEFRVDEEGTVTLSPVSRPASDLYGILEPPPGPAATVEEMNRSIAEEVARQHERSRR